MTEDQPTARLIASARKGEKDFREAEGTLEMQRMVLQKLAKRENQAKGFQSETMSTEASTISLEELRRKTTQALHTIWGSYSRRKHVFYRRD
jgi:hypothetical protein